MLRVGQLTSLGAYHGQRPSFPVRLQRRHEKYRHRCQRPAEARGGV